VIVDVEATREDPSHLVFEALLARNQREYLQTFSTGLALPSSSRTWRALCPWQTAQRQQKQRGRALVPLTTRTDRARQPQTPSVMSKTSEGPCRCSVLRMIPSKSGIINRTVDRKCYFLLTNWRQSNSKYCPGGLLGRFTT
jgi:hypothetical protein